MQIINIQHRHQISYLLHENGKWLVFDAGWPDSFQIFASIMKEHDIQFRDIAYLLVSHFHMDHCGTVEQFKQHGVTLLLHECQAEAVERANHFFLKKPDPSFVPITQTNTKVVTSSQSRILLHELEINGQMLATPGHSDDSISLSLDSGEAFTGDLPLFELREAYADQTLLDSWNQLLARGARTVYPAHGLPYTL